MTLREIKITLPKEQARLVDGLVGKKGNNRADVVARIVENWLEEKGHIKYDLKEGRK